MAELEGKPAGGRTHICLNTLPAFSPLLDANSPSSWLWDPREDSHGLLQAVIRAWGFGEVPGGLL